MIPLAVPWLFLISRFFHAYSPPLYLCACNNNGNIVTSLLKQDFFSFHAYKEPLTTRKREHISYKKGLEEKNKRVCWKNLQVSRWFATKQHKNQKEICYEMPDIYYVCFFLIFFAQWWRWCSWLYHCKESFMWTKIVDFSFQNLYGWKNKDVHIF